MSLFNYFISVTGDCQNTDSGAISLLLTGGTPPYTVEWVDPDLGVDIVTLLPSVRTSLSADTYGVRVNDSTLPLNLEFYINIPVSSGVCCNILGVQSTTCNLNNGVVTGSSTSDYSSTNFFLYSGDGTYITSGISNTSTILFNNLTAGTYYMVAQDLGGCTGQSSNFIIEQSTPLTFGLYVVPNTSCGGNPTGKIIVTGQTGTPPYTYLWDNLQTGSTITGLTSLNYSVQVTDAYGCTDTQSAFVPDVSPVGLGLFTATQPTCFASNGVITIQITGGTAPYYYSASTGDVTIQYSQTWSISGLSSGYYSFSVTDAAFCNFIAGTTLQTPLGIASVTINTENSTCSSNGGKITVSVAGGTSPYTYTLISPGGNTTNIINSQTTQVFDNLTEGTYSVAIQDAAGCSYIDEVTILTVNTYTISTEITGTTCNQNNGSIYVSKSSGGQAPYNYTLDNNINVLNTNLTGVTFNNVTAGQHTITVSDATGCTQTTQVYVAPSDPLDFSLLKTSCGTGSNGSLTSFISSGTPPFIFDWSTNVPNNPQQIQVTGLTAGTYSLTIIDSNNCSLTRNTTIDCNANYTSYQTYVMGSEVFNIQSQTKYGLLQMLNEGYNDITSGNMDCSLVSAVFGVTVSVNPLGLTTSQNFFTSTSLVSAPTDNLYYDTVTNLLQTIPGIGTITIDALNNQITIQTVPGNNTLNGQEIVIDLTIVYDTMCLS
jgi:uncharacterized protein (DUF2141 family)